MRSPVLWIGILGALVRLVFLWTARGDPSFDHPLVDAKTYHDLASRFADTGGTKNSCGRPLIIPLG
jgi:hypothetical protein